MKVASRFVFYPALDGFWDSYICGKKGEMFTQTLGMGDAAATFYIGGEGHLKELTSPSRR